jgi:twitching motility two-component system response regulator PilG
MQAAYRDGNHPHLTYRSRLVMIADDSQTIRKIVEVVLTREGYDVIAVPDGVEALRYLIAPAARLPDLIVLDIQMPRLDGYELAQRIRRRERPPLAHIPIVMLSRRNGIVDRLKARLCGVHAYLSKPFTEQQLVALVGAMVGPPQASESACMMQNTRR